MSALSLRFTESRWCVYVRGPGASRMLRELRGGKPAEWDRSKRAFVVTERLAGDLLAWADGEGRRVIVTGRSETEAATQAALW